jgi:hypothetical protein
VRREELVRKLYRSELARQFRSTPLCCYSVCGRLMRGLCLGMNLFMQRSRWGRPFKKGLPLAPTQLVPPPH